MQDLRVEETKAIQVTLALALPLPFVLTMLDLYIMQTAKFRPHLPPQQMRTQPFLSINGTMDWSKEPDAAARVPGVCCCCHARSMAFELLEC